jgi:hypothetical protein
MDDADYESRRLAWLSRWLPEAAAKEIVAGERAMHLANRWWCEGRYVIEPQPMIDAAADSPSPT